jgi:hypothetical protein
MQARGVCDALRDAEILADSAHIGLSGDEPLDAALAEYHHRRDAATLPGFHENLQAAQLGPVPAAALRLREALRVMPADVTRYFLAIYGRIPRDDFFNPPNLERILGSALQPDVHDLARNANRARA